MCVTSDGIAGMSSREGVDDMKDLLLIPKYVGGEDEEMKEIREIKMGGWSSANIRPGALAIR